MTNFNDPRTIGLLGMAAGLLQAGGPSATPVNFGQAMGQGIQGGIRGLGMGQQMQLNNAHMGLYGAQGDALRQKADMQKRFSDLIFSGAPQAQASAPNMTPGQPSGTGADMPPQLPQQAQPTQAPGNDWLKNMTLAQVAAAKAAGMGDFTEEWKLAQSGVPVKAGDYRVVNGKMEYVPDPAKGFGLGPDGNVVPIAGAADVNAAYQGAQTLAQERAKASLDMVRVPLRGGGEKLMTREEAARLLGGGGGPRGPMQGASGFGETQSPADQTYQNEAAKTAAEQYKTLQNEGISAQSLIPKIDRMQSLLSDFNGSKLSPTGLHISQALRGMGIDIDKSLPNKEAFEALGSKTILDLMGGKVGVGVSDGDRKMIGEQGLVLGQSAEGRKLQATTMKAVAQRQIDMARMGRQWQQRFGRLDNPDASGKDFFTYATEYGNANPIFKTAQ